MFVYYGDPDYAKKNAEPLMTLDPYNRSTDAHCALYVFDTYYDYQSMLPGQNTSADVYVFNDMISMDNISSENAMGNYRYRWLR